MKLFIATSSQLQEAVNKIAATKIPDVSAKTMYKVQKLLKKLTEQDKTFQETRQKLVKTYAKKDDSGELIVAKDDNGNETVTFEGDNLTEFQKEFEGLMNSEVDEDFKVKFEVEELEGVNGFAIMDLSAMVDAGLIKED